MIPLGEDVPAVADGLSDLFEVAVAEVVEEFFEGTSHFEPRVSPRVGAMDGTKNGETFLVNSEGKYLVAQINAEGAYKRFKKNGNVYELVAGSGTGSKKGADEVAVVGTMTDQDDGVFTVGSTQYTMNSGALIPEANVYGSLVPA